jgi:hypothetical protein
MGIFLSKGNRREQQEKIKNRKHSQYATQARSVTAFLFPARKKFPKTKIPCLSSRICDRGSTRGWIASRHACGSRSLVTERPLAMAPGGHRGSSTGAAPTETA